MFIKQDSALSTWYGSFREIVKHMKRTPDFLANGRQQLLKQLSRTAENGATWTILNLIWVHSVVMITQDLYCEVGKNPTSPLSDFLCDSHIFCVIPTSFVWFDKKITQTRIIKSTIEPKCHLFETVFSLLQDDFRIGWTN